MVAVQPIPRTLEHWHTPGLFEPVEPPVPVEPPQLQFTVCEGTTAAPEEREEELEARNAFARTREDSAVNPGNLIVPCVFIVSPFLVCAVAISGH
jgi:hypothetical protein